MSNMFSIGDLVTFVNEKQNGVVVGFKSGGIVVVEIEDGFPLDVLAKEIVIVKNAQVKAMGVANQPDEIQTKKSEDNSPPDYTSLLELESVSFLAIPESAAVLTGKIRLLLVNPLNAHFQCAVFVKSKNQLKRKKVLALEAKQQEFIGEFTRDELMDIDAVLFVYSMSNESQFTFGNKELKINLPQLIQPFPQLSSPWAYAVVHEIVRALNSETELDLSLLKDKFSSDRNSDNIISKPHAEKQRKQEGNLLRKYGLSGVNSIVDLHIESLIEYPEAYSNNELIRIQLNHFRSELDKAMIARMQSIVFIHGVGNGVLKDAIISEIKELSLKHRPADFSKYGIGATEVLIV